MPLSLNIPNQVLEAVRVPRSRAREALTQELAFSLYARGMASFGTARRLGRLTKWEFMEGLAEREIQRHYHEDELKEDLKYAKNGK
ncbi:MAG: hypothetical protein BWX99_02444 [Deltaproteobacteria bacterium ADurb.Bin151]|nr:MAG: hypothetical protein BWX99_02444 [Deltaproteobacteria bacterium ADurb.Bin151]